jgi:hypothetical protein
MVGESWVDDLVAECSHVETPESYLWWSFLCCISAAAGNNYFLTSLKGDLIYKPNLYVMLLGESGLGKGFPINRAKLLVQKAEVTRVIAGRSSIQGIIKEAATAKTYPNKPLITDSRMFIVNGELSTAIIQDPDALTILTDLFDGNFNPEWTNLLKGDGAEKLKMPYVTALFGSSPAHFYDSVPQANIEGGYIGRNLIIYEEKRSQDVDLLDEEDEDSDKIKFDDYLTPKYIPHLQSIGEHKGRITPSEGARKFFNSWRREWRGTQEKYNDKTGFINRVPDHSLKVAMCLSLARYEGRGMIDEVDMADAIKKVTALVYSNERTAQGVGLDPLAQQTKLVVNLLLAAPDNHMSRKIMLGRGYGNFDTVTLDRIIDTLMEMGWVRRERFTAGKASDYIYHLSGEPLASYQRFRRSG